MKAIPDLDETIPYIFISENSLCICHTTWQIYVLFFKITSKNDVKESLKVSKIFWGTQIYPNSSSLSNR